MSRFQILQLEFYPTPEAKSGFQDVVMQRLQYITVLDWVSLLFEVFIFLFTFFINSCFILGIETKNQILLLELLFVKEHIVILLRYYNDHYREKIILKKNFFKSLVLE